MKTIPALIAAAAATLLTSSAFAADSSERTSMPDSCSDRDANCVIQDGPARRHKGVDNSSTTPPANATSRNSSNTSGANSKSGGSKSGEAGSSR